MNRDTHSDRQQMLTLKRLKVLQRAVLFDIYWHQSLETWTKICDGSSDGHPLTIFRVKAPRLLLSYLPPQ
jgi:hypothetical protein